MAVNAVHVAVRATAAILAAGLACSDPPPDPDLATPLATARTLLRAWRLDRLSDEQITRRLRRGLVSSAEHPPDERLLRKCFADLDADDSPAAGMPVFLVGAIAARQSRLRESVAGDGGTVYVPDELLVVFERTPEGWKIVLERSVPAAVRSATGR